jgi:hypothetical protein
LAEQLPLCPEGRVVAVSVSQHLKTTCRLDDHKGALLPGGLNVKEKMTEMTVMRLIREETERRGLTFVDQSEGPSHEFRIRTNVRQVVGVVKRSDRRQNPGRLWVGLGRGTFIEAAVSPGVTGFIIVVDQLENRFVCLPFMLVVKARSPEKRDLSFYLSLSSGRYYLRRGKGDEPISLERSTDDFSVLFDALT